MTKIPTGYDLPNEEIVSDADIKSQLLSEHKQTEVKKIKIPNGDNTITVKGLNLSRR